MAPVKIYGLGFSVATRRVLMTLEEKGVEYELVPVDILKGEHKLPEHLQRQPFGVIPTLEDDGFTLFESRAIARYVANAYAGQGTDLLGEDIKQKAKTDNWLDVEINYFNGPCSALVREKFFKPVLFNRPTDEAAAADALNQLSSVLDVYEAHLANQPYLTGQDFSLADISHLPFFQYAVEHAGAGVLLDTHPNVKAWWERISSRPSWKKLIAN